MRLRWPMLVAMGSPVHEGIHIYIMHIHISITNNIHILINFHMYVCPIADLTT